jgi:type II secretory pathway predicted ATPase ExeA
VGQGESRWDPKWGRGRSGHGRPPFGETVITAWHLERSATEEALEAIEWEILRARRCGALVAPVGLGRTHLLRVVGDRINPVQWESLYLPNPIFDFEDFCRFVLGLLDGLPKPGGGVAELDRRLEELWVGGRSLLLLVDDADHMPEETVRACLELAERQSPTLVVLFALRADTSTEHAVFGADREGFPVVAFDRPLDLDETRAYVAHRLARSGISHDLAARFGDRELEQLHVLSRGFPARLHALAQTLVETPVESPEEAWPRFLQDERGIIDWLGRPDRLDALDEESEHDEQEEQDEPDASDEPDELEGPDGARDDRAPRDALEREAALEPPAPGNDGPGAGPVREVDTTGGGDAAAKDPERAPPAPPAPASPRRRSRRSRRRSRRIG